MPKSQPVDVVIPCSAVLARSVYYHCKSSFNFQPSGELSRDSRSPSSSTLGGPPAGPRFVIFLRFLSRWWCEPYRWNANALAFSDSSSSGSRCSSVFSPIERHVIVRNVFLHVFFFFFRWWSQKNGDKCREEAKRARRGTVCAVWPLARDLASNSISIISRQVCGSRPVGSVSWCYRASASGVIISTVWGETSFRGCVVFQRGPRTFPRPRVRISTQIPTLVPRTFSSLLLLEGATRRAALIAGAVARAKTRGRNRVSNRFAIVI